MAAFAAVPTNPNAVIEYKIGNTTLIIATGNGDTATVFKLLDTGADPDIKNKAGDAALHVAAKRSASNIITFLWLAGCNINLLNGEKNTALFESVKVNCIPCVTKLMEANANTTTPGLNGADLFTPASLAAAEGYMDILSLLAPDSNAPAFNTAADGLQPLHWAIIKAKIEPLKYLLEKSANANEPVQAGNANRGATPLLLAIAANSTDCSQLLIDEGARIEAGIIKGIKTTPMKLAIDQKLLEVLQTLVTHNATLLTAPVDTGEYPPLGYAAAKGLGPVAAYLLKNLSAPLGQTVTNDAKNAYHKLTAAHIAAASNDTTLLPLLLADTPAIETMALASGPAACNDIALSAIKANQLSTVEWLMETHYKNGIPNFESHNWSLCTDNANCTAEGATPCTEQTFLDYAKKLKDNEGVKIYLQGLLFKANYAAHEAALASSEIL